MARIGVWRWASRALWAAGSGCAEAMPSFSTSSLSDVFRSQLAATETLKQELALLRIEHASAQAQLRAEHAEELRGQEQAWHGRLERAKAAQLAAQAEMKVTCSCDPDLDHSP